MDRVFLWIARANSLLLLLLLLGAGGLAAWQWFQGHDRKPRRVIGATELESAHNVLSRPTFGYVEPVTASSTLMIPFGPPVSSGAADVRTTLTSGPHSPRETHNILFLSGSGKHFWLFGTNNNFLRIIDQVRWRPRRDSENATVALYFEFASADTNADRVINRKDEFTVALARPDGSGLSEIIHNARRVLSHELVDQQTMAIIYQTGTTIRHARYRVNTFEVLFEHAVVDLSEGASGR